MCLLSCVYKQNKKQTQNNKQQQTKQFPQFWESRASVCLVPVVSYDLRLVLWSVAVDEELLQSSRDAATSIDSKVGE